jgi:hypothetical protein
MQKPTTFPVCVEPLGRRSMFGLSGWIMPPAAPDRMFVWNLFGWVMLPSAKQRHGKPCYKQQFNPSKNQPTTFGIFTGGCFFIFILIVVDI